MFCNAFCTGFFAGPHFAVLNHAAADMELWQRAVLHCPQQPCSAKFRAVVLRVLFRAAWSFAVLHSAVLCGSGGGRAVLKSASSYPFLLVRG
jgi:hypothetical protein